MKSWFEPTPEEERRDAANRMKRIAHESKEQEEAQIPRWLELARRLFDKDDDPDPQAA